MKDSQLTLRLPQDVVRAIARLARERGVAKSQVVREAIQQYVAAEPASISGATWDRVKHMVGSLGANRAASERDQIARMIRKHNWRG